MSDYKSEDVIKGIAKGMFDFLNIGTTDANCQATQKVIAEGVRQAMSADGLTPAIQEAIKKATVDFLMKNNTEVLAGIQRGVKINLDNREGTIKDAVKEALQEPYAGFGSARGNSVMHGSIKIAVKEFLESNQEQVISAFAKSGQTQPAK